ncbi:TetR/AcrR family transcriptional regulator C-terminal domain-containing protein [Kutzneria sp. NPDC052558]|uniref:TetR/AcrR family transcriptional regulator C-terminal domain-containing protein n=1 Tax=Kutzneria sp. NPDC052558 TaxID=3364121 RepID=UPI0037CB3200
MSRTPGTRAGLSRERVLAAALELVDRDGLKALSMRRLGAQLDVEAMTLYHYVPTKDALLDGLVEQVLDRSTPPSFDGDWRSMLDDYARSLRSTLLAHPNVLPLVAARPAVTPETLRTVERGLRMLVDAGFPLGRALDALNALSVFVIGHATSEVHIDTDPALPDLTEFPLLSTAARTGSGIDDEARFRFAVDVFLTGLAALGPE